MQIALTQACKQKSVLGEVSSPLKKSYIVSRVNLYFKLGLGCCCCFKLWWHQLSEPESDWEVRGWNFSVLHTPISLPATLFEFVESLAKWGWVCILDRWPFIVSAEWQRTSTPNVVSIHWVGSLTFSGVPLHHQKLLAGRESYKNERRPSTSTAFFLFSKGASREQNSTESWDPASYFTP